MKRRSFLRHSFHALAVPGVLGSMGFTLPGRRSMEYLLRKAAESDKALVMIFLEGGNDGLNTVIPLDRMSELNAVRPKVVLDEKDLLPLAQSNAALHPSMKALRSLYNEGKFQIIQNVGYPEQNFSHFRSTDIWMSGSDSNEVISSGWIGRHLEQEYPDYPESFPNDDMKDPLSVEIGYGSSLLFQGATGSMSVTVDSVDSFYELIENVEQDAPNTPAGDKLKYLRLIARQSQQYGQRIVEVAGKVNSHVAYPSDNYLADQLKIVSKLIAGGSQTPVYMVRLNGFDTHDAQVESNHSMGFHANLLEMLDDGIDAFMKDLDHHGIADKVLGMTFSEFGRTILSNASNGTDHGTAAPMFFFGNAVKGGVTGNNPVIDSQMTYADNLPYEFDFRQLYGSVLEQWFGLNLASRNNILLDQFSTVQIIGDSVIASAHESNDPDALKVFPNPLNGQATIAFVGDGTYTRLEVRDLQGREISRLFKGTTANKPMQLNWSTSSLPSGRYFVVLQTEKQRKVFSVVKN